MVHAALVGVCVPLGVQCDLRPPVEQFDAIDQLGEFDDAKTRARRECALLGERVNEGRGDAKQRRDFAKKRPRRVVRGRPTPRAGQVQRQAVGEDGHAAVIGDANPVCSSGLVLKRFHRR